MSTRNLAVILLLFACSGFAKDAWKRPSNPKQEVRDFETLLSEPSLKEQCKGANSLGYRFFCSQGEFGLGKFAITVLLYIRTPPGIIPASTGKIRFKRLWKGEIVCNAERELTDREITRFLEVVRGTELFKLPTLPAAYFLDDMFLDDGTPDLGLDGSSYIFERLKKGKDDLVIRNSSYQSALAVANTLTELVHDLQKKTNEKSH